MCAFLYQFLRAKLMLFDGALHLAALVSTTLTECVLQDCIHLLLYIKNSNRDRFNLGSTET